MLQFSHWKCSYAVFNDFIWTGRRWSKELVSLIVAKCIQTYSEAFIPWLDVLARNWNCNLTFNWSRKNPVNCLVCCNVRLPTQEIKGEWWGYPRACGGEGGEGVLRDPNHIYCKGKRKSRKNWAVRITSMILVRSQFLPSTKFNDWWSK